MKDKRITTAPVGSVLSHVRELREAWGLEEHFELWFRAEDAKHRGTTLQPKLYRPRKGKPPKPVEKLLGIENDLYEEFRRCAGQLSDLRPEDDWDFEWYFLMQHHGVPTRLLDWSDGVLIALHFAIRNKRLPAKTDSVVYVLDPYWLLKELDKHPDRQETKDRWKAYCNKCPSDYEEDEWERLYLPADEDDLEIKELETPKIPMLWDSPHLSRRVAAQRSRFMIFGTDPKWISGLLQKNNSRIAKVVIDAGAIRTARHELRDAGITESVIFPDLDGLGRELEQQWRNRR